MIITKARIDLATERGKDGRPVLQAVHYNAEKGRLEAADGFILASVPVELEEGESVPDTLLPVSAIREAQNMAKAKGKSPSLTVSDDTVSVASVPAPDTYGETVKGATHDLPDLPKYPDVNQIVPPSDGLKHLLTIDVQRLYDLVKAICESTDNGTRADLFVNLYQGDKNHTPIVVEPLKGGAGTWSYGTSNARCREGHIVDYDDGPFGLLMPLYHE